MWKDLSIQWQTVFNEAWKAMQGKNVPAGAAIFNSKGELLAKDHNRCGEHSTLNPYTSHACVNAINRLDIYSMADKEDLILYTSMEPCHMCLGTAFISRVKTIFAASRDLYFGSSHFIYDDPMIRANNIKYIHESGDIELFQLVLQSYYEIMQISDSKDTTALNCYKSTNETAFEIAEKLYIRRSLQQLSIQGKPCSEIYDMIMKIRDENYSEKTEFKTVSVVSPAAERWS